MDKKNETAISSLGFRVSAVLWPQILRIDMVWGTSKTSRHNIANESGPAVR